MARRADRNLQIESAGEALRELRTRAGLTLQDLADRINQEGWDRSRLSKYETNKLGLSLPVIEEIAAALGYPPLFVVLHCLKHRYPDLKRLGSKAGRLLESLVRELSKPTR